MTLTAVRRWLSAVGEDPQGFNPTDAVPPLFLVQWVDRTPSLHEIHADGIVADVEGDSWGGQRVAAADELTVLGRVEIGDVVTSKTEVLSVEPKSGRSGRFLLIRKCTQYYRKDGELIAVRTHDVAVREAPS